MQELFKKIALVAPTDVPVLITGESGTGKELVARAIHRHSRRRDGPFVPVCLAALSPSLVERELFGHLEGLVHRGEPGPERAARARQRRDGAAGRGRRHPAGPPGEAPAGHRAPRGDAGRRRPAAADRHPGHRRDEPAARRADGAGQFREDLFFRLSVFPIHIPPLRDRRDDIPALAEHFLRQSRLPDVADARLTDDVLDELRSRPWAGNVRELRNAIEHAAIVARGRDRSGREHLPAAAVRADESPRSPAGSELRELARRVDPASRSRPRAGPADDASLYERFLELVEPPVLRAVLEQCQHNRAAAAEMLGIHRATLRQKLRKYGIE